MLVSILFIQIAYAKKPSNPEWQYNPCTHLAIGQKLGECVNQYHISAQKKLNATFQRLLNKASGNPYEKKHWQKSQQKWQEWIEYECQPSDPNHSSSYVPVMVQGCQANKMRLRERYLRDLL